VTWSPELFDGRFIPGETAEEFAITSVSAVVNASLRLGVPRREFSLVSKVLHWLLSWRMPVYDSFVRQYLDVPTSWGHPQAYRRVVKDVYTVAAGRSATFPGLARQSRFRRCAHWTNAYGGWVAETVRQQLRCVRRGVSSTSSAWHVADCLPDSHDRAVHDDPPAPAAQRQHFQ
jgi:hypothetical protein